MIFLIVILLGLIPAFIASSKGRSFALWWIYGALLFIIALPHALLAKSQTAVVDSREKNSGNVKCPSCAEWIRPDAKVCKHCGRDVGQPIIAGAIPNTEISNKA